LLDRRDSHVCGLVAVLACVVFEASDVTALQGRNRLHERFQDYRPLLPVISVLGLGAVTFTSISSYFFTL
jgi:uncharacterized membrane protein